MTDAPATEVLVLESLNPVQVFSGGLDPIIERITREAKVQPVDISTEAGRKACASLAYKVARSKTYLDDMGKKLGEDARKQIDAINADRKKVVTALDALKNDIRKPLDDWEQAEKDRVAAQEAGIENIIAMGHNAHIEWGAMDYAACRYKLDDLKELASKDWQEFSARAKVAIDTSVTQIKAAIAQREKHDADQAELARLKAEQAARDQAERDAKIAADAAAKAKADAERIAKEAADKAAAEAQAAAEKAEQDRLAVEREKQEAIDRAAKAEADRIAAEQKAIEVAAALAEKVQAERVAAEAKAKHDADAAVEAERKRVADAAAKEAAEVAKREANTKHRAAVNNAALAGLVDAGLSEADAKTAITAIAKGDVAHVSIAY